MMLKMISVLRFILRSEIVKMSICYMDYLVKTGKSFVSCHGCKNWTQIGSDWHQMGQIWDKFGGQVLNLLHFFGINLT